MSSAGTGPIRRRVTGARVRPRDDLTDTAIATYLTLESCRDLADSETAGSLEAAMAQLEDVARYGHLLSPDDQRHLLDELRGLEEMVEAIRQHLCETRTPD